MPINIPTRFLANNPATGFSMPGMNLPAPIPGINGLGGAAEPIAALDKLSKLAKLRALAMSPAGLAGLATAGAIYNDPGTGGFDPFLGMNPNDEPDDLGMTSIGKMGVRGAAKAGNDLSSIIQSIGANSPFFNVPEYLLSTNAERGTQAPAQGGEVSLIPSAQAAEQAPPQDMEYAIPGLGAGGELDPALDQMMAVLAAGMPQRGKPSEELNDAARKYKLGKVGADASRDTLGGATKWTGVLDLLSANNESNLQQQLQGLQEEQAFRNEMQDWLKNYTRTGVDVAKEKREAKKDDFKIHSTKGGFLVEMNDENGNKVLKPISPFGGGSKKLDISGSKFTNDNPLSNELNVLQNLSSVGILNDIMLEHNKDLMAATKGITDPKQIESAKLLTLARAMHNNPQFKASLIQKYSDSMGQKPGDLWASPPPAEGATDFVTGLGY